MKLTKVQTNFTSGELSPELLGRSDIELYQNGADQLENVLVSIRGGARRRDGMRFVKAAKFAAKKCRVIPFVFSTTEAYILEVGDLYMRFYKNNAQIGAPYEIVTVFTEAQIFELEYVQGADTMIITHQGVPTHRLRRFGDQNWPVDAIPFEVMAHDEIGHSFSVTLTLSAASIGTGRTATASGAIFLNGDVGRTIFYQGGTFKITSFTSTTVVVGDISSTFPGTAIPADVWTLAGSPQETITPSAKDPIETLITLTATLLNIWRASDVGKFVRINGGLVRITVFTWKSVV